MWPSLLTGKVTWDPSTLTLVAEGGTYARIIRLQSGDLLCCYQRSRQSRVKRSTDNGATWGRETTVTNYHHGTGANPELIQLQNGEIWLLFNERPNDENYPYAISRHISKDDGKTWGKAERLFTAGKDKRTGCWEPVALQYPDGETQIFFANELPYKDSDEQEISMISSLERDKVHTVAMRANARDGMPVPVLLANGEVVIAIEDSDIDGKMKPVILRSDLKHRWREGVISGNSPRRERALTNPLPTEVYAGAPYICQLPNGATVLSVQSDEDRDEPRMVVYTGDSLARNFRAKSVPFPTDDDAGGYWSSLFAKGRDTVSAVSATTINGVRGIWTIDGIVPKAR